jgi:shikimate kinase
MEYTAASNVTRATVDPTHLVAALGGRSVVMVGMMGAGKSSVGRRLARALDLPFRDADSEIEAAAGMSVPEIFDHHGEAAFRAGEAKVIRRLLGECQQVLATGGGAWMNRATRAEIAGRAVSIWLNAEPEVLLRRVRRRTDRPLLQTADPEATLRELLAARAPAYALADVTVLSREVPHEQVVAEIMAALDAHLAAAAAALGG